MQNKPMRTHLLTATLLILLFSAFHSNAQKTFPGLYVSKSGETIKGDIVNYSQWGNNPSQIEFRAAGSTNTQMLTPPDIQKLVIDGYDEYISFSGKRLVNAIDDYELINGKGIASYEDKTEDVSTFLRLIFRSAVVELYIYSDAKRINFYCKKPGEDFIELQYKKYYDGDRVHEMAIYRDQVGNMFSEQIKEKRLSGSVGSLRYREESLEKFFGKLFPGDVKKQNSISPRAGFVVMAGASFNSLKITADKSFQMISRNYNASISPMLSVGYVLPIRRYFGRYFFQPQLKLYQYKNSGSFTNATSTKETTFQSDLLIATELNAGLNMINKENIRWYVTGGGGFLFLQNNRQSDHRVYIYGDIQDEETELTSTSYSLNFSTGFTLNNRFIAAATYQVPVTLGEFVNYRPVLSVLQFGIGYKF